jgi:hypothetical protein
VLHKEFSNDIYGFYECFPNVKYNGEWRCMAYSWNFTTQNLSVRFPFAVLYVSVMLVFKASNYEKQMCRWFSPT